MPRVLNVGGGGSRVLPSPYRGWEQVLLDIDPQVKPDVCCDALQMMTLPASRYDAVYCSHNLEHFYWHDVPKVLQGFVHVLKKDGFVHLAVPDLQALMQVVVEGKRDLQETWYVSAGGPIRFHDVLYGWNKAMSGGNLFYAHKCGFTESSLTQVLRDAGFVHVYTSTTHGNLEAYAFRTQPTLEQQKAYGLACR